jgi:hypothetical protein
MTDSWDDHFLKATENPELPPGGPKRSVGLWIVVALLIAAGGVAIYVVFGGRSTEPTNTVKASKPEAPQPVQPLGGDAAPITVPPLDQTDTLVRQLVRQLSSHPRVAAWLAADGLVRNFTVVVANIAEGRTPARHLRMLRPSSSFRVVERGNNLHADPRNYERYNDLADAVAAIDPKGAAGLYATFKPRIEEAYRELGSPDTPFDQTLERAIVLLLETPAVDGALRVEPKGIGYGFVDTRLEDLSGAQKQLLRMGPRNMGLIQAKLREVALALGIPPGRLPENLNR